LTDHIVTSFAEELEQLSINVSKMGGLAEAQLQSAIDAITRRDMTLADRTVAQDQLLDDLELLIEENAIELIALRQPMALDLREAMTAIKIASDLERIGDLAKNISKRSLVIFQDYETPNRLVQGLSRMGKLALGQLKLVLDAYTNRDVDMANRVWVSDEEIDEMYNSVFRELLTYMMEDPRMIGMCTHLLFVAKNIERIGDHATNIAETVSYLVTGDRIVGERPKGDKTSTTSVPTGT